MKENSHNTGFALGKKNYVLIGIGFIIIIIGFLLMRGGATTDPNVFNESELFSFRRITLAPVVILFGFVFEVYAIMKKPKENKSEE
jgi:membrane-bound ClpP family serine protease